MALLSLHAAVASSVKKRKITASLSYLYLFESQPHSFCFYLFEGYISFGQALAEMNISAYQNAVFSHHVFTLTVRYTLEKLPLQQFPLEATTLLLSLTDAASMCEQELVLAVQENVKWSALL